MLPLVIGAAGRGVRDLTARLRALGFDTAGEVHEFGPGTAAAVTEFQATRGLEPDGVCDQHTWAALGPLADQYTMRDLGELEIRGRRQPVRVFGLARSEA